MDLHATLKDRIVCDLTLGKSLRSEHPEARKYHTFLPEDYDPLYQCVKKKDEHNQISSGPTEIVNPWQVETSNFDVGLIRSSKEDEKHHSGQFPTENNKIYNKFTQDDNAKEYIPIKEYVTGESSHDYKIPTGHEKFSSNESNIHGEFSEYTLGGASKKAQRTPKVLDTSPSKITYHEFDHKIHQSDLGENIRKGKMQMSPFNNLQPFNFQVEVSFPPSHTEQELRNRLNEGFIIREKGYCHSNGANVREEEINEPSDPILHTSIHESPLVREGLVPAATTGQLESIIPTSKDLLTTLIHNSIENDDHLAPMNHDGSDRGYFSSPRHESPTSSQLYKSLSTIGLKINHPSEIESSTTKLKKTSYIKPIFGNVLGSSNKKRKILDNETLESFIEEENLKLYRARPQLHGKRRYVEMNYWLRDVGKAICKRYGLQEEIDTFFFELGQYLKDQVKGIDGGIQISIRQSIWRAKVDLTSKFIGAVGVIYKHEKYLFPPKQGNTYKDDIKKGWKLVADTFDEWKTVDILNNHSSFTQPKRRKSGMNLYMGTCDQVPTIRNHEHFDWKNPAVVMKHYMLLTLHDKPTEVHLWYLLREWHRTIQQPEYEPPTPLWYRYKVLELFEAMKPDQ